MQVKIISPNIGAEIYDLDLRTERSPELQNEIHELLGRHEVLFFKRQPRLTHEEYLEVAGFLGKPMNHPFISTGEPIVPGISPFQPYKGFPQITGIYHDEKNKGNLNEWHSDLNWLQSPSQGSVLRCLQRAEIGGDTVWASMTAAYRDTPAEFKELIADLRVVHDFTQIYRNSFAGPDDLAKLQALYPARAHPLVAVHPTYKKKALFANRVSATKIEGVSPEQSKEILERIYAMAKIPEYQCRFRWEENDIAIWDNVLTQHYAVSDYWPHRRKMERISLAGLPLEVAHV